MKTFTQSLGAGAVASLLLTLASACNPLKDSGCTPSNPALGKTVTVDFTKGASGEFSTTGGAVSYNSNGAQLAVTAPGIAPTLISNWYIMFGRVEVVMQTAPGVGMVSSAILQSDDLDEIDWEILGATPAVAQTNYFGKGLTLTYDREADVAATTSQTAFNTYTIDWDSERITWAVNGVVERTLLAANADPNQYPQTPMQINVGPWAGGDAGTNAPGTVTWAGGNINWANGPFLMQVKSITVQDYSQGSSYNYPANFNGAYSQIVPVNGFIGAKAGAAATGSSSSPSSSAQSSSSAAASTTSSASASAIASSASASVTTSSGTAATRTSSSSANSSSQAPFSNSTTKASTTNTAAVASASSARSSIASGVSASMGTMPAAQGLAGQISAITATTLITTSPGATQGSTVTSIVRASSSAASGTTRASSSSASIAQQTGNAAIRGSLINAGAVAGAVFGAAVYAL